MKKFYDVYTGYQLMSSSGMEVHLYKNADMEELRRLQEKVMQISATIYTVGQHGSSYLKGLKCALSLLGICSDYVAAPFHKFEQRERGKIWKALQNLGVDVVLR